jgi:hypothetical protein
MRKPHTPEALAIYKARRKEIQALYYQRHRSIIKLAWSLDIPMKHARKIARELQPCR